MVAITNLVVATAFAAVGLGSALPPKVGTTVVDGASHRSQGRTTIRQVANPRFRFNGARSVYRTFLKYGVNPPEYLVKAVANTDKPITEKRVKGSAPAVPLDIIDIAYITPVTVGTPPQTLNLDLDTGSSDLWVFSSHTPTNQVRGQEIYSPNKSSTSKLLSGHSWSITYGDGSGSRGNVYTDNFTIGGVTAVAQAVQTAQQVSSSFTSETDMDGLVGLGFSSLNTVSPASQLTFFDNIKSQLDAPLFSVDLKYKATGSYDFGYIDEKKHTGTVVYTPVNPNPGYWTFSTSGYAVGNATWVSQTITGIADTGTTLVYLPTAVVTAYYRNIQGASNSRNYGGYVFPCSADIPSFTFGIGSATITIPPSYIAYAPVTRGSSTCFGGLQSSSGLGINIWGDVALKAAYVVFNAANPPSIGWANKTIKA